MDAIPYSSQEITEGDINAVTNVLRSKYLTQGPEVQIFESELKQRFGVSYAVCCSSGTAAIHLSYAAMGVDNQSIGFVPAVTFSATANPVIAEILDLSKLMNVIAPSNKIIATR